MEGMRSRLIPAERHAHVIFFFAHLQRVHDLIRYLPKSMFMAFSPLPAYRGYVISSDTCRTACSFRLPLGLITEGMRACLIPAEQYGHTFSC